LAEKMLAYPNLVKPEAFGQQALLGSFPQDRNEASALAVERHHEQAKAHFCFDSHVLI